MNISQSISTLKSKLNNDFIRNLSWLGGGELIVRVSRLLTTVILARFLTAYDYGLAALVLTVYEFTQVFTRIGIAGKVIQADKEKLEAICNSAYWLNWVVSFGVFLLQCIAAFPVAWFYRDDRLIIPICLLATVYLITPFGRIQSALIQRENRLKITAISSTVQVSTGNILTAIFAFFGGGMWAIILPKTLAAPIDIIFSLKNCSWRLSQGFTIKYWGEIFQFGVNFLGIALLAALRNNLDYLIVGRFLGVKELGIYFFAFNAGLGISLSIIQSITVALYPHLCAARDNFPEFKKRYFSSIKTITKIMVPLVLLQSSLAPFYVPIVFSQRWASAVPILIIICLSAIPRPYFLAATNLLAAIDKPQLSLQGNILFTVVFAIGLLIGVNWGAMGVAVAVLLSHWIFMPLFTIWATRYVFGKDTHDLSITKIGRKK